MSCTNIRSTAQEMGSATLLCLAFMLPVLLVGLTLAGDAALVAYELRTAQEVLDEATARATKNIGHFSEPQDHSSVPDRHQSLLEAVRADVRGSFESHPLLLQASQKQEVAATIQGSEITTVVSISQPQQIVKLLLPVLGRDQASLPKIVLKSSAKLSLPRVVVGVNFNLDTDAEFIESSRTLLRQEAQQRLGNQVTDAQLASEVVRMDRQCGGLSLVRQQAIAFYRVLSWMKAPEVSFYSAPSWRARAREIEMFPLTSSDGIRQIGLLEAAVSYADGYSLPPLTRDTSLCLRLLNDEWLYQQGDGRTFEDAYLRAAAATDQDHPYFPDEIAEQLPTLEHFIWAMSGSVNSGRNTGMGAWLAFLARATERSENLPGTASGTESLIFVSEIAPEFSQENRDALLNRIRTLGVARHLVFILASASKRQLGEQQKWEKWRQEGVSLSLSQRMSFVSSSSVSAAQDMPFKVIKQRAEVLSK
jgi:hypothetical protein